MGVINNVSNKVIYEITLKRSISPKLIEKTFINILSCKNSVLRDVQLGQFLTGLQIKGLKISEGAALLRAVLKFTRLKRKKISYINKKPVVMVAGSGKKFLKTINISTPASITASSSGKLCIVKNVSHATSSLLGSADFLSMVGANIKIKANKMLEIVKKIGFGAFSIEGLVLEFDLCYGGRFFTPTSLSYGLAAILSPFSTKFLYYGLSLPDVAKSINILSYFGFENILAVTNLYDGKHCIDEILPVGKNIIMEFKNSNIVKKKLLWYKKYNFNIKPLLAKEKPEKQIKYILELLQGKGDDVSIDALCLNSGAILYLGGVVRTLKDGYHFSKSLLKKKIPFYNLLEFIKLTGGQVNRSFLS